MECSIKKISTALALPADKIGCLKKSVERTQEGISNSIIKYKCTDLVTGLCNLLCRDESDIVCASRIFKAIPKYSDEKIGTCGYFWGPVTDLFNTKPTGQPNAKCVHAYNDYISGFATDSKPNQVKIENEYQVKEVPIEIDERPSLDNDELENVVVPRKIPVPQYKPKSSSK
jgi:hypothetical protein